MVTAVPPAVEPTLGEIAVATGAGTSSIEAWVFWMRPPLPVASAAMINMSPSTAGAGAGKLNVQEARGPPVSEQGLVDAVAPAVMVTFRPVRTP